MLMPIVAAVGSFVVSERILKPKATALFVLACLAVYDVFVAPPASIAISKHDNGRVGEFISGKGVLSYKKDKDGKFFQKKVGNPQDNALEIDEKRGSNSNFLAGNGERNTTSSKYNTTSVNLGYDANLDEFEYSSTFSVAEEDDLTTSFRCYRGPALLAVAFFCSAYSLRVWRRNGVACDELLFLPGTPHEFRCHSGKHDGNNNTETADSEGNSKCFPAPGAARNGDAADFDHNDFNSLKELPASIPAAKTPLNNSTKTSFSPTRNSCTQTTTNRPTLQRSPSAPNIQCADSISPDSPIATSFSEGDAAAGSSSVANRAPSWANGRTDDRLSSVHNTLETGDFDEFYDIDMTTAELMERKPLVNSPLGHVRKDSEIIHMDARQGDNSCSNNRFNGTSAPAKSETSLKLTADPSAPSSQNPNESLIVILRNRARFIIEAGLDMLVTRPSPLFSRHSAENASSAETETTLHSQSTVAKNEVYDAEYAPSGPSVLGAALDLSLPVLFNFHMFVVLMKDHYRTEAETQLALADTAENKLDQQKGSNNSLVSMTPPQIPPQVLPLIFLSVLIVRSQIPPKQRRRFYKTLLEGTAWAPFKPVRFLDAFVGDCMTSLVRPIVDFVFAMAYFGASIYGFLSQKYDLNQAGRNVSDSKVIHGLILPLCAILPLWWRFLQTLRQAYDTGKRWPYLGNSLKYSTAGLVILYGMTHAAGSRGVWWTLSFIVATIYQIVWDSLMDWELLIIVPPDSSSSSTMASLIPHCIRCRLNQLSQWRIPPFITSLSPRLFPSRLLGCFVLPFRKRISQPLATLYRRGTDALPRWDQIRLRPQRLFDDDTFYWRALFMNAILRFCWMMGFIPAYRVSILDGSTQETFARATQSWTFVILSALEIFRRCIWGIIKVELETIKLTSGGVNDLALASTADEYLREGMWNVWRGDSVTDHDRGIFANCGSPQKDVELAAISPQKVEDSGAQYSPVEPSESASFLMASKNMSQRQTYRWFGMSVSSGFLRWAYLLELSLWPVTFLVLSYYVVSAE